MELIPAVPSCLLTLAPHASCPRTCAGAGHTKGVLHVGSDGGFWLVHSTPKWPLSTTVKNFYFPDSETKFGQTFLCITLSSSDIDDVAGQILINQPYVYYNSLTSSETSSHPKLKDIVDKNFPSDPTNNTAKFAGMFTSYAKNRQAQRPSQLPSFSAPIFLS